MVMGDMEMHCQLLIIGGGPGGYGAALRGAELGLDVALVDNGPTPGGHYLRSACLPTKYLLDLVRLLDQTAEAASLGVVFPPPKLDFPEVCRALSGKIAVEGEKLALRAKKQGVLVLRGTARFVEPRRVRLDGAEINRLSFDQVIIAVGSSPRLLSGAAVGGPVLDIPALWTASAFLPSITVVGGGYIGVELATILAAFGSRVTLLEKQSRLLTKADEDLVVPLVDSLTRRLAAIRVDCQVTETTVLDDGVTLQCRQDGKDVLWRDGAVLVAIGRQPAADDLGLERAFITTDQRGYIIVNERQQTNDPAIFAVGDIVGDHLLAHTALRQGRVAAEVAAGHNSAFDVRAVPKLVHTRPQLAWCGLTEEEARNHGIRHQVKRLSRPFSVDLDDKIDAGFFAKLLTDPDNGRILGVGLVGEHLDGFIGEAALAVEMGGLAEDLALVLHPFPVLGGM
jgi:dihydrolipoamide dehydrogenase